MGLPEAVPLGRSVRDWGGAPKMTQPVRHEAEKNVSPSLG